MPRQAVRVLPVQVPGVREEPERHVLPAAGAELRAGLAGVVLHPAVQQVLPGEDARQADDGQGGAGAHVGGPKFLIMHCTTFMILDSTDNVIFSLNICDTQLKHKLVKLHVFYPQPVE